MTRYQLHHGDCLAVMRTMDTASVDAIVTDPPYELGFMGKAWDASGIANSVEMWGEALRVLKPGGHLLAFSGSRTYHRMTCAIEDAGFEVRDQIMWVYSSGFPKSHNLDNYRGALICGCESEAQRGVHLVRHTDVSPAVDPSQGRREVLQPSVPQQGASPAGWQELPSNQDWRAKPCMEGWRDAAPSSRQLPASSVCEMPAGVCRDGESGWVRDGAPLSDGSMVRPGADAHGMRAPHQPQATGEPARESGTVAGQPQPQAGGAWPVCGGCGKPILPQGLGTALKPAHEPICMARKPLVGTVAMNVQAHGTGALNIDKCRVQAFDGTSTARKPSSNAGSATYAQDNYTKSMLRGGTGSDIGRWPANLIHDGSEEVLAAFPDAPGQIADASRSAEARKDQNVYGSMRRGRGDEPSADSENAGAVGFRMRPGARRMDAGSAARFFYCAKASRADRNEGTEALPQKAGGMVSNTSGQHLTRRDGYEPPASGNPHPTVKPTDLMAYLCRLVTPPGGLVLDPFMGSGSTGKACMREGFRFVGIDMTPEYVEIARARIQHALEQMTAPTAQPTTLDLFAA